MTYDEAITIQRPAPPDEVVFQKSGGLNVALICHDGRHVWVHTRGQQPRGCCMCGERTYAKMLTENEYASLKKIAVLRALCGQYRMALLDLRAQCAYDSAVMAIVEPALAIKVEEAA